MVNWELSEMNFAKAAIVCVLCIGIQGCAAGDDVDTSSAITTPDIAGNFSGDFTFIEGDVLSDGSGNAVAYQVVRVNGENELRALAGIVPGTDPGAAVTDATATYDGAFGVVGIRNIDVQDDLIVGDVFIDGDAITLSADFVGGTLTGNSGLLTVSGTVSGQDVGGSVNYDGINAPLEGVIGQDVVVGAFAGNTSTTIIAGGIGADRVGP